MNKQAERELKIDRDALDDALIQQPELFLRASQQYIAAVSERDDLKERVAVVKAQQSLLIRRQAEEENIKLTEAVVVSRIEVSEDYREAMNIYLRVKSEAEEALALKESFQQRAFVLKDLAQLYIAGYFGTSSVQGQASREIQEDGYKENRKRLAKRRREKNV